jgi:hypothetical protein
MIASAAVKGEVLTGLLYSRPMPKTSTPYLNTTRRRSTRLGEKELCPGPSAMWKRLTPGLR